MTLLQALAKSEELDCFIVNREAGMRLKHDESDIYEMTDAPKKGWELDDTPMPISFQTEYLGSDLMHDAEGKVLGTVYSFTGQHVTHMPKNTKVTVRLEPTT